MPDLSDIDHADANVMLSIVMLYWSLHDRLTCEAPDLSKQERLLLIRLSEPRRMGDLARFMQALPSTMTALTDGLEAKGLVARRRDPKDRRAWLLELTETGRETRAGLGEMIKVALREETGLCADDLDQFSDLLMKIRSHILAKGLPKGLPL
ncbi:MarR family transcriptional regulator [Roseovarius nubinhibens]|uniref:MarR family winged helix-turn-helix transcriptional regulator n=1 Tax=Roseovarius nubinhibens TaxID=314263 RepID=UPI001C0A25B9|nr:MarR family transcriptional regulator [Roseovarius nubinhibens]MBU2999963.1 MarR family transcriptional regulator [Roseovarius nubinhibens]